MRRDDVAPSLNDLAERVIGAALEVHRELGAGFAEVTYHRALMIELEERQLRFASEVPVQLLYRQRPIGDGRIDLLVEDQLVVELKAADANPQKYRRQVAAYLKATRLTLGLVINFESGLLKDGVTRVVNTGESSRLRVSAPSAMAETDHG